MNFQEYVNQKDPQRQAPLSVKVTSEYLKTHYYDLQNLSQISMQDVSFVLCPANS